MANFVDSYCLHKRGVIKRYMHHIESTTEDYDIMYTIGKGATSEVFYAKHRTLNLPVAIKGIPKSLLIADKEKGRFLQEVSILKEIDNEYIASLYDIFSDENNYYFVIDLAENGSFESLIKPEKPCTENHAKKYFSQLMSALSYIHNVHHIIHRDIKADNILLDKNFNIKLIDFGMSNLFDPTKNSKLCRVGSPAYVSPEVVLNEEITEKSDLWSAGVFLYFITAGHLPFMENNMDELFKSIVNKEVEYPTYLSPPLRDLISHMLSKDPNDRPTIEEIATHPWFGHYKVKLYSPPSTASSTSSSSRSSSKNTPRSVRIDVPTPRGHTFNDIDLRRPQIDQDAIDALASRGVNVTGIEDMIAAKQFNKLTAMYRIIKSSMRQPRGTGRVSLSSSSHLKLGAASQIKMKSLLGPQAQMQRVITQPLTEKKKKGNFVGLRAAGNLGLGYKSNITMVKKLVIPIV